MKEEEESMQYPIGMYHKPKKLTEDLKQEWITAIEALPKWVANCIENIDEDGLEMPYREKGWTIKQVVHHLADVHMNAYIRLKLALSETNPTVKSYNEKMWATFPEAMHANVNYSISLLQGLHLRWAEALRNMSDEDWKRTYFHPEQNKNVVIWEMIALYAWHGSHHVAQIRHFYLYRYAKLSKAKKSELSKRTETIK